MNLVINARRADRLEAVADRIRRAGCQVEEVVADVTHADTSTRLLDVAARRFGRFHVVFANAGYGIKKPAHDLRETELREMFEVNFFAPNDLLRKAAQRLILERRRGHLLMCSSSVARFALPEYGAYCATKAAQAHICQAMHAELKPFGIQVSSVHPIATATEFFNIVEDRSGLDPNAKSLLEQTPKSFIQTPERVAQSVVACLRNPRTEVWTSLSARLFAAAVTACPSLLKVLTRNSRTHRPKPHATEP